MAALHVSSLPPGEKRAEFERKSFGKSNLTRKSIHKSNLTMVVRFMAGLTKFQLQDDIEGVLAFQKNGGRGLVESCLKHMILALYRSVWVTESGHWNWNEKLWIHLTVMFLVTVLPTADSQ